MSLPVILTEEQHAGKLAILRTWSANPEAIKFYKAQAYVKNLTRRLLVSARNLDQQAA